jgi:hypothetical protein
MFGFNKRSELFGKGRQIANSFFQKKHVKIFSRKQFLFDQKYGPPEKMQQ